MDKKNLMPNQASPINRMTTGQLPPELAELSEETLCSHDGGDIVPSTGCFACVGVGVLGGGVCGGNIGGDAACFCSYDGDDAE